MNTNQLFSQKASKIEAPNCLQSTVIGGLNLDLSKIQFKS